jgi:alkanesulfonate monooxygenase SsuD/methylene tetrahydromethanopterin reductase-like flavin-dependent oxidoreductase (luciferase family)
MKFAIEIAPFGELGEARNVMKLALAAEAAGWDGLFIWDHLGYAFDYSGGDVWVLLSAAAAVTERIRLGSSVTPLPRRRPQVLAQTLVSLDRLSNGRLIFGAGLGASDRELDAFGETMDLRERAARLDEGLEVLDRLLQGETLTFAGQYYSAKDVTLQPRPVQQPRPPVWIGGESRPALRRAARWDGWSAFGLNMDLTMLHPPEWYAEQIAYIHTHRNSSGPFDVAVSGVTSASDAHLPREYADAGATWWFETLAGLRGSVEEMLAWVNLGPPK